MKSKITYTKKDVLYHLSYEWWMFNSRIDLVSKLPIDCNPVRNALIDSCLFHGRTLIDFFYSPENAIEQNKTNDLTVVNLGSDLVRIAAPTVLDDWPKNANKRVAQRTSSTNILPNPEVEPIRQLLKERIEHVKMTLGEEMLKDWIEELPVTPEQAVESG
jgi:hypothetical protein